MLKGELSLQVDNEKVTFSMFKAPKDAPESSYQIDLVDTSATEKISVKVTKHPDEPDKFCKAQLKPLNAKRHSGTPSENGRGRMLKLDDLRNEPPGSRPTQLHHDDMSGISRAIEEKSPHSSQEWIVYKTALGWSVDDVKGHVG